MLTLVVVVSGMYSMSLQRQNIPYWVKQSDNELTSQAGYAGGKAGAINGCSMCHHNATNIADYGKLGHAEVVNLNIPVSKFEDFAKEYVKLFNNGLRPDQNGNHNLISLPSGPKSEYAKLLSMQSF